MDSKDVNLKLLLAGVFILAGINTIDMLLNYPFWTVTKIFSLAYDNNFSAWYSSILLFIRFLLAYSVGKRRGSEELKWFSYLLLLMSADEISQFHETAGHLASKYLGLSKHSLFAHADWVWIFGPVVILLFVIVYRIIRKVFSADKKALKFVLLGFVLIVVGGVLLESTINFLNHNELEWIWRIEVIVEETLEMLGSISFIYVLMLLDNPKPN